MIRVILGSAAAGIVIALALLGLSVCCFEYVPWGHTLYALLWPTTRFLDSVVDPVRPAHSEYLILLAAFANGIPYGVIGALVYAGFCRCLRRPSK
jgi:hypothetical protein